MSKKKTSGGDGAAKTATTNRRKTARAARIARSLDAATVNRDVKSRPFPWKRAATPQRAANKAWATALKVAAGVLR